MAIGYSEIAATMTGVVTQLTTEEFLMGMGRRKFLKPIYQELVKTPEGHERARDIYARARPRYHSISQRTLDEIVQP